MFNSVYFIKNKKNSDNVSQKFSWPCRWKRRRFPVAAWRIEAENHPCAREQSATTGLLENIIKNT